MNIHGKFYSNPCTEYIAAAEIGVNGQLRPDGRPDGQPQNMMLFILAKAYNGTFIVFVDRRSCFPPLVIPESVLFNADMPFYCCSSPFNIPRHSQLQLSYTRSISYAIISSSTWIVSRDTYIIIIDAARTCLTGTFYDVLSATEQPQTAPDAPPSHTDGPPTTPIMLSTSIILPF